MINWVRTKEVFPNFTFNIFRPKIVVNCDKCNKEAIYTVRVKSKLINNNINWICQKCICIKISNQLSKLTKKSWKNKEYKEKITNLSKELWKNEEYKIKHNIAVNTKLNKKKCSDSAIKAWTDKEYRIKHVNATINQFRKVPSTTELVLIKILDDLKVKYQHQYLVGPYSFDFIIYTNKKPILLEANGDYWHTRPNIVKKDKAKESYINSIDLYNFKVIWESELVDHEKIITLLKDWVGISKLKSKNIKFNDLSFSEIDRSIYSRFFGCYHYLGSSGRDGISYGGYVNDDLVCCAILSHPIKTELYSKFSLIKKQCYELTRIAISPFYFNKNLKSLFLLKLIEYIKQHHKDIKLISFVDQIDSEEIYQNWEFDEVIKSSYFYINDKGWKMHVDTLYKKARGMHLSVDEYAKLYKYKIVDQKLFKRYIYHIDNSK